MSSADPGFLTDIHIIIWRHPISMSTRFCEECGAPLDPGTQFCGECGARVTTGGAPETPDTPAPVVPGPSPEPVPPAPGHAVPLTYILGAVVGVGILILAVVLLAGPLTGQSAADGGMPTAPATSAITNIPTTRVTTMPATTRATTPVTQTPASSSRYPYKMGDVIQGLDGGPLYVIINNADPENDWYWMYKVHRSDDGRMYLADPEDWGPEHTLVLNLSVAATQYKKVGYTPIAQVIVM